MDNNELSPIYSNIRSFNQLNINKNECEFIPRSRECDSRPRIDQVMPSIGQGYQVKPSISIHSTDMTYQTHCYDAKDNNVPHNAITIKVSDNK